MNISLKSKKVCLGIGLGLLSTTSIVTPISLCTSCSENVKYIDSIDEKFDVSSVTYNAAKRDFKILYRDKLEHEFLPEEDIQVEMEYLQKDLDNFDSTFKASEKRRRADATQLRMYSASEYELEESKYLDYTTLTNALVEFANEKYDVQLVRKSTATWGDLRESYTALRNSTQTYMEGLDIDEPTIQALLAQCDEQRDAMMTDLQAKYGNDALAGLINGLPRLMSCFDAVNKDIAAIAATNMLKEFFNKYTLVFDEKGDHNHYDEIQDQLIEGEVISDTLMKKMFKCVEQKSGNEIDYDPETMIPGYKLTPTLHAKIPDPIHNTYKISIDWALIRKTYLDPLFSDKDREDATGHVYGQSQDLLDGKFNDKTPIADVMRSCEREYLEYSLYPTAIYESKQIGEAYFNKKSKDGYIRFKWNDIMADNKYEQFFAGIADPKGSEGTLTLKNLADSGLQISNDGKYYTDVNDLLDKVGEGVELDDEDSLTLAEKFIRNCDVKSAVEIVNGDDHIVTNDFSIEYRNSHYKNSPNKEDEKNHWYRGLETFHNDGYPISPEFFVIANEAYNHAKQWVDVYRNKKIDEMYDASDSLLVSLICSATQDALYTAYYCFRLVVPFTMLIDGTPRPNWACAIALGASEAILLATYITLVTKTMIIPFRECADNNAKFLKSASFEKMAERIDKDEDWFCPMDENGKYDKTLYKTKMNKFCMANFQTESRPLYQYYSNFHQQEACKDFVKGIVDNHIDSVTIQSITDKVTLPIGSVNVWSASYTALSFVINLALGPTTNPFKPWHWGIETWLWAVVFLLDQAIKQTIKLILYIVSHTIKKFVTGIW